MRGLFFSQGVASALLEGGVVTVALRGGEPAAALAARVLREGGAARGVLLELPEQARTAHE